MSDRDWSHQQRGVSMVRASVASGHRAPVFCMATGGGKSRAAGEIIRSSLDKGKKSLFIVHRRNLVNQFVRTLEEHFSIRAGCIMAGEGYEHGLDVYVGTVQTAGARIRSGAVDIDPDIILIDECHRGISPQYDMIYETFPSAIRIGFTATPCRADGRGLGAWFDDIVDVADCDYLTRKGILAPVRYFTPDAAGLEQITRIKRGEYDERQQADLFTAPAIVGDTVAEWLKNAQNRPTIVFAVNVAHSRHLQAEFTRNGVSALHLDAKSTDDERDEVFRKMEAGEARVVCNVGLYVEGMDVPDIWCVVIARKTASLGAYRQMIGRGLRNPENPAYPDCIVIDQGGNYERHDPVTDKITWSLDGKKKAWRNVTREKGEPKEKKCRSCTEVFETGSACPRCGTELRPFRKDVVRAPGELAEVTEKRKSNKDIDWVTKRLAMGAFKFYASSKGYEPGWASHAYRKVFGVWPNDWRVKAAPAIPAEPGTKAANLLRYVLIRQSKGGGR